MIVIVDYGIGNLCSIANMFKKVDAEALISSKITDIERAEKLVLPGVGAFDNGIKRLNEFGLVQVLNKKVLEGGTPILGICLGMQLFGKKSEEGRMNGLGWLDAETVKLKFDGAGADLKIPHMGWNTVNVLKESFLFDMIEPAQRFYFVHSYHLRCNREDDIIAETHYGCDFVSAVKKDNIVGVQFHPEKSHRFGMELFRRFVRGFATC